MESFQKQENPFNDTDNRKWGEEDFGENFDSILNLLKRGHNDWSVNISRVPALTYPGAALRLKVSPQPVYNSSITRSDPQAFTAGGVLSIIYSAHYGFKGSMHYQMLCPPNLNTLMWVNYFPDAYTKSDVTIFPVPLRNTQYTPNLVPSAPKCYFNLALNSAARVKIPYYSCSEFIQLNNNRNAANSGDEAMISSLGSLTLGFDNNNINDLPERFKITIIKSVGDDAGLYFFMGFPPMYHFDEFPVQNFKLARDSTMADIELNPGPIFSKFVYNMGDAFGAGLKNNFDANNIGSKLTNGVLSESLPFIEMFKQALSEHSAQFSQLLQDFSISNVLLEFVTQIGHCLISKTWYNCIWAILTIFVKFGLFSFIKIREMCNLLLTFLKGGSLSSQPILDNDILPENTSAEENSALISYVSIFITSMCGLVGISSSSINKGSIAKNFGKDLKDALVCGNALTTFLKSHMELIKDIFLRIKHYILGKTSEGKLLNDIIGNRKLIGNWLKEVDYLTDPKNLTNVSSTPGLQVRIRVCHTLGRALQQKMVLNKDKASNLFNSYYKRIGEKYEELASNGFISHIRETPFVIYNWGPSGVGKSEMSTDLIAYLFNELEIVPKGEMVYTLSPTSAFYDGITDQPCIYIDDFMCINQPEPVLKQFDLLFCAATSATFRPPQAHLTDKKKISNPDLIYINGNLEKIVHDSITDLQAFNRRLQCKIHTFVNPIYTQQGKSKATDFDPETLSKFDHLLFKVHLDSYKYNKNLYTEPMTYMEMRKYVLDKMREHRVLAKQSQQRRLMRENMSRYGNMFSDVTYEDLNDESYIQKRIDEFINDVVEFEMSETSFFTNVSNEVKTMVTSLYQDIFSKYYLKACDTFCGFSSIFFDKANDIKCENSEEDVIHYTIFKANIRYVADESYRNYCYNLLDYMEETYEDFRTYFSKCLQIFDNDQYVTYNLGDFIIKSSVDSGNMKKLHYCNCRLIDWECRVPSKHCKSEKCVLLDSSLKYFDYEPRKICYVKQVLVHFNDLCSRVVDRIYKVFKDVYSTNLGKFILCILGIIGIFSTSYLLGYAVFSLLKFFGFVDEDMTYADAFACTGLVTCECKKCKKEFQARLKFYNKLDKEGLEIENHYDNAPGSKKKAELRVNISKLKTNIKAQSQMLTDTVAKMRKNYRYLLLGKQEDMDENKDVRSLVILGLTGNSFVFLKHYLDDIRNAFQLNHKVKLLDKNVLIELVAEDFADSRFYWRQNEQSNSELGIWSAPASVNQLPNITKFFASENLWSKAGRDVYIANCHQTIDRPDIVTHISAFEDKENTVLHNYNHIVQYENFSQNGYCMSLVFSCSLQKPIAVHAFGSETTGKGYGEMIFKEHLSETINEEDIINPPTFDDLEEIDIEPEDYIKNLVLLGKVPQHQQPFSQGITQLIKSPIHGEIVTQNKEPAPLSMYDKRVNKQYDPMAEGVKKHGCPPTSFNQDHLKICAEDTLRLLLQNARPLRMDNNGKPMVGELSIAEAIVGIPELGFKALDLGTSPGYPLLSIRDKGDKGKRAFIKAENDINGVYKLKHISSHLRNLLAMDRKMRINRQMVFSPAIDCLKDELLKIEKARRVGGTRVFSISPVQQVIACKRVFGDFLMTYRKNWQRLEHGIGINPESSDWMFLFKTLKKHPNILEGDYSNFGPQAESSVAMAALTNVVKWYKHYGVNRDHLNQMETLVQEFVNAPHLCKNFFYNTNSGIISGSFATAEMNSEINKLYIRLAWCSLVSPDMHLFNEHVTLYTYGDDMIACVSDEYIDKFNVETIGTFFATKNINFTNASKSKTWIKSIKLEEATFLKRGFRVDPDVPNQCLANLEKISIEEQLNWVKKKDSDDHWSLTLQSIDSCLRSASMWGKEYYNDLKSKIELSLIKHNKNYTLKTFERQIKDIYDTDNGILTSVPVNIT